MNDKLKNKTVIFCDLDGTLIETISGETFPKGIWDKPKVEKFNVNTLRPFDKVLTRCDDSEKWNIDLFGYFDYPYKGVCCLDAYLQMCIPYNDETKHLVGTENDCPDYYKWWEK